jgi:hypothetical protein
MDFGGRRHGRGKSEEQDAEQSDGAERRVRAAMQIAQPVESLQGQGEAGEQPDDEQAARVVIADVLQPVAVLGPAQAGLKPWFSISQRLLAIA